jgi:hypothetical protein
MNIRTRLITCATIFAFTTLVAPAAFADIELPRGTSPVFSWEPISGPVHGYGVYSYCNGSESATQTFSFQNTISLYPQFCDTLVVRVAAWQFGPDGGEGPLSEPSETIRFVDEAEGGSSGGEGAGDDTPPDGSGVLLDFDGEGSSDILAQNAHTGQLQLWALEAGQAVLASALPSLVTQASVVGNGDMNGDGSADLLYLNRDTGELGVWLIAEGAVIGGGAIADLAADWDVVGNADHDADGRADVLFRQRTTGELELWTMNGPELLEAGPLSRTQDTGWQVAATGDYDGDGHADVLWHDPDAGQLDIWLMNAHTVVANTVISLEIESSWSIVAAGDFDLDGRGDIVWRSDASGELGICFLEAGGLRGQTVLDAELLPGARIVGAADYDGDGLMDLLIQLSGPRGSLRVLFMNGSEILENARIGELRLPWFVASVGDLSPVQ